jgi:hypothetical protein
VGSHLASNSNQIVMSIFGNNPANAESGVIAAAPRGGAMKEAFYYASASDPIYYFASVSAPPTGVNGNNPQGVYAHFPNQAHESGASGPSDHEMVLWDQSTDIDSTPGGRIFSFYDYGVNNVRQLSACTCTSEECAQTSCVINAYNSEYSYPGQATGAYFAGNGYASAGFAPGAGLLRSQEIISGTVNHAIMLEYSCGADTSSGNTSEAQYIFPANQGVLPCGQQGTPATTVGLANGNLLWIDSGYNCGQLPAYQQGVCKAMQTYGGYTHDTGGQNPEGVTIMLEEQGTAYTAAGVTDPLYAYLKSFTSGACANASGWSCGPDGLEVENDLLQADIPWFNMPGLITATTTHLHIIDPCIAVGLAGLSNYNGTSPCQ